MDDDDDPFPYTGVEALLPSWAAHRLDDLRQDPNASAAPHEIMAILPPLSRGAIYRRHCMFKYRLLVSDTDAGRLVELFNGRTDPDTIEMTKDEFFGNHFYPETPDWPKWRFLTMILDYKAERARRLKKFDKEKQFLLRRQEIQYEYRGHTEMSYRDALKLTSH
jgi:hypothetical protein